MRRDVLRKLAGSRYLLTTQFKGKDGTFWIALNEIGIAYMDDDQVMHELRAFEDKVSRGFRSHDLVPLMRAMAAAAKLPAASLDEQLIEYPFAPPVVEREGR